LSSQLARCFPSQRLDRSDSSAFVSQCLSTNART
jgi:hypothetical protein